MKQFTSALIALAVALGVIGRANASTPCDVIGSGAYAFPVTTLQCSGPYQNRINIVFMGDGYTASEQSQFVSDATSITQYIMSTPPFDAYKNFINVYAIQVPSEESGAKHPHTASDCPALASQPIANPNNYFGSTFDSAGTHRFLLPTNTTAISNVLAANTPFDTISAIVVNTVISAATENSPTPGGPYYGGAAEGMIAVASNYFVDGSSSAEIMAHELGHSLAGLGDEYSYSGCGGVEEWNATTDTDPTTIRWSAWLTDGSSASVANSTSTDLSFVGIYEGANYCATGWYRPAFNCKMRALGVPYCPICTERFAYSYNFYVKDIDSVSPQGGMSSGSPVTINLTGTTSQTFTGAFLSTIPTSAQPTNTVRISWVLDGAVIAQDTNSVTLDGQNLTNGNHTFEVDAHDSTSYARVTLPTSSQFWNISVSGSTGTSTDTTPPTASITAPVDGSSLPGAVVISASVSDNVGVTKVEVYAGTTLLTTLTSAPYSYLWTPPALGTYSLTVKAFDAAGNVGTSNAVSFTSTDALSDAGPNSSGFPDAGVSGGASDAGSGNGATGSPLHAGCSAVSGEEAGMNLFFTCLMLFAGTLGLRPKTRRRFARRR